MSFLNMYEIYTRWFENQYCDSYIATGRNLCYTIKSNSYKRLSKAIGHCVVLITLINKLISVDYNIFV